jgi:polysaccharide deacetylase family protein (PEP-CTERM system associated)
MINALTIDIEDYFQVENFRKHIPFTNWHRYESRVAQNTERILGILDESNTKSTFFVLGWVAERNPELVKKIHRDGHEVASHGYAHQLIYSQSRDEFREDLRKAKSILENIIQQPVIGYRAPSYSITKKSIWALDILMEEGFRYDSSLFPIHHDKGGFIKAERYPHKIYNHNNYIWEFPLSTVRILGQNIPFSGGGYFRLLPYRFVKWAIKKINLEGHPVNIYVHPWEFDSEQPKIKADFLSTFRHYVNIAQNGDKFKKLLRDFQFRPIKTFLD